jgi:hypothetical protein
MHKRKKKNRKKHKSFYASKQTFQLTNHCWENSLNQVKLIFSSVVIYQTMGDEAWSFCFLFDEKLKNCALFQVSIRHFSWQICVINLMVFLNGKNSTPPLIISPENFAIFDDKLRYQFDTKLQVSKKNTFIWNENYSVLLTHSTWVFS